MKLNLTTEKIINKQFKKSMRGYEENAVNEFLNLIIADYERFERSLNELKAQNETLKDQIRRDQIDIDVERTIAQPTAPSSSVDSDLLMRIARLEKTVFSNNQ